MRRAFLTSAIVVGGLFAAACSDQRAPLPTQPPASAAVTTQCPSATQIEARITALFPPKDLLASARDMWNNVQVKVKNNDFAGARKKALMLIDFTLKNYYRGKLLDPHGADPPTTQQAVVELIDGVLCFVGLPPSGLTLGPSGAPVTTTVIGSSGGALKASDGLSGLKVDPGTVSEDRLWVITRRDDLAQAGTCVTTKLQQIPLCIDFSVVPAEQLAKPLLVVLCQPEDNHPADRRLAHQLPNNKIELLALQRDPFPLVCTSTPDLPPPGLGSIGRQVWRFGSLVARLLGPKPLYASHSGIGGLLGPGFSDVTAVRTKLDFIQQPANTAAGAPITPAVTVAFKDVETGVVDTDVTNRIRVAIDSNPGAGTLSGTTTQSPSQGIATFADLSIDNAATGYTLVADAISSDFTDTLPLGIPVTSNTFDIITVSANWAAQSSGTSTTLFGVWGASGTDVFAVGDTGTILHYDGTRWTAQISGTAGALYAVWGTSGNDVFAVGGGGGPILHYNGVSWEAQTSGMTDSLYAIWGTSGTNVFAVGYSGTILHYDGTGWTPQISETTSWLRGVWGAGGSDVFAVGFGGTILHYNGETWAQQTSGTASPFYGVWGASGTDVFAVGNGDSIFHYNGTNWTGQSTGVVEPQLGVWGANGSDVFAVGNSGTILHYNGTGWDKETSGTFAALWGVWGASGSDVFAVGSGGTVLHRAP